MSRTEISRGADITWDYEKARRITLGLQKITVGITRDYRKKTVGIIIIAVGTWDYIRITKTNVGIITLGLLANTGLRYG